jgi:hypothetical protein
MQPKGLVSATLSPHHDALTNMQMMPVLRYVQYSDEVLLLTQLPSLALGRNPGTAEITVTAAVRPLPQSLRRRQAKQRVKKRAAALKEKAGAERACLGAHPVQPVSMPATPPAPTA